VLAVLSELGRHADPTPAAALATTLGLPRSTTYQLLGSLCAAGFVVHLADERRYALGVGAYELAIGYTRQAPLARLARMPLAALVDRTGFNAHLAVLHGREVVYLVEERAPGRPPLVTDVGVRLPAQLTASGRAILAGLPREQIRALFGDPSAFVLRNGTGPRSLNSLRQLLSDIRAAGHATEAGEVTPGFASVAVAVRDHNGFPVAAVALTYPDSPNESARTADRTLVRAVDDTATDLSRRIGG
jgi:DNA-binding IclR family transcriptional regulator